MSDQLNFFWPGIVYRCNEKYYINRAWFHNELTEHFFVRLFSKVSTRDSIDEVEFQRLDPDIDCIDFFDQIDSVHFIKNYYTYKSRIFNQTDPTSDLYFIMYPYRKTSIFLAKILSETDLTIWVKSDYVGLFGVHDDSILRSVFKKVISPGISLIYPWVTKLLFRDNIVFYTGDIMYDRDNHLTQYGITSLSPLNADPTRIKRSIENKIVFVGNESNQKGLQFLLEALVRMDRNLELTIIGADEVSEHSEYTSKLDINCLGRIYDNERFYDELAKHDVLVMPSICERQGKVQIEAMSTGVVPICSDSGGTYTTVDNYYTGLLFEEKNVDGLVETIREIYDRPSLYHTLQQNGLQYTQDLNLEDQVDKMATVMKNQYRK